MTKKQQSFTDDFREQALAKVLGRSGDQSVRTIAAGLNMSAGTLRNWMKAALHGQKGAIGKAMRAADFTAAQRLVALGESHGLGEDALNAWCRERGLFTHDLTQWRSEFCQVAGAAGQPTESEELRQLKLANQQLQRDLNRKEKALAEAAALLVLQKKYRALWAAEDV
jgi:transposase-like protein